MAKFLNDTISNNYPDSILVWRRIVGISLSPQTIKLKSKDLARVIVNERLHKSPFNLSDLEDNSLSEDNIMLYKDGVGQTKLRYRKMKVRGKNSMENQWEKIKRQ